MSKGDVDNIDSAIESSNGNDANDSSSIDVNSVNNKNKNNNNYYSFSSLIGKARMTKLLLLASSVKAYLERWRFVVLSFVLGAVFAVSVIFLPIVNDAGKYGESVELFGSILNDLDKTYVDEIDTNKLFNTAVQSMLSSLDPYTEFESRRETQDMKETVSGRYGGVGLVISGTKDRKAAAKEDDASSNTNNASSNSFVKVVEAFEGYAYDAGMRVGDRITQVNSKSVVDMTVEEVRNQLRGAPGTVASITFVRDGVGSEQTIDIERKVVKVRDVKLTTFLGDPKDAIGYVRLGGFSQDAGAEVRASVVVLQKIAERESPNRKLEGLVLDLRGNPGGLLTSAVDVSSLFVPKGSDIVSARGRGFPSVLYRSKSQPLLDDKCRLVVLVNSNTASAAEIVSGAVQDLDVGVILGADRTYGKGLVQNVEQLPYQTALKYTVAKYFTPSGRCIQSTNYDEGDVRGFKATNVKDADRNIFKTKSGRIIKDGGGIEVDVKVNQPKASALEVALIRSGVLDDFASQWSIDNSLSSGFRVSDDLYRQFQATVLAKEKSGEIPNLTSLYNAPIKELERQLGESGYKGSSRELGNLRSRIRMDMSNDFKKYSKDIKEDISTSILSRYLPESMLLEKGLKTDQQVVSAIRLIKNPKKFDTILAGRDGKEIGGSFGQFDLGPKELADNSESSKGKEDNVGVSLNVNF